MDFALAHHEAVRRELPSGTVTFLFTDVEGSTKLLHEVGAEQYAQALAEHRRIVRDAVAAHGGVEVDTQGDAFFVAFPTAPGALAAAGAALEDLSRGPIQVRMGIHTGTPHVAEEGYVGADVHRAARIAACGHGGQVVVSASTASLVDADGLRELGRHRLKDFDEPVSLYQLGTERFPPLKTISNTNLPHPASSFVGRDNEVEEVATLLRDRARLVTLTGPGGSGKTRLALEAAGELVPAFTAGVFWVGLAPLRDPALVAETIAKTLGAKDGLADHIGERELLLLLDNLEQVVEAAPELASLVETCPNLRLLVTSRELLRVRGEVEYPVLPLAEPEAVELFYERARTEPDVRVEELCRALDNLPLALELAAARASVLSPKQILERLSGRLDLLKGGRDADPRQQTLRATIEWSYELLPPEEQNLFARLAVFRGGCTLEAAEEVADADLDSLQSLVDKNLLRQREERFWMLETIREYAAERLEDSGEAEELRRRHGEHFLALAEEADPGRGAEHDWLDWIAPEHDNMRAALDRYEAPGETDFALRLAAAVWRFWNLRGYLTEGRRRLESALAADARPTAARAKALIAASVMAGNAGDAAAARLRVEEALALCRELGDVGGIAAAEYGLGHLAADEGDFERARRLFEASVRRHREVGDEHAALAAAAPLAWVYDELGERERGRALEEENLRQARALGNKRIEAYSLSGLAMHALHEHRFQDALTLLKESLRIHRDRAVAWDIAYDVQHFGRILAAAGRAETAARLLSSGEAQLEEAGFGRNPFFVRGREEALADIRAHLDEAATGAAWEEGRKLTVDEAVALALDS
jgi:predicted ATPase/class 3 adenylate cyclase